MSYSEDNIKTNFNIIKRSINIDIIGTTVKRQYIRLIIIFILIFVMVVLSLKEYLLGLRFIKDYSITDTLFSDSMDF